jgi:hypothetical protein
MFEVQELITPFALSAFQHLVFGSSEQQHGTGAVQQRQEGEEQPGGSAER